MQAPSAATIEEAWAMLSDPEYQREHATILAQQDKELRSARPCEDAAFYAGFALAMATARLMLMSMPAAQLAGIEL